MACLPQVAAGLLAVTALLAGGCEEAPQSPWKRALEAGGSAGPAPQLKLAPLPRRDSEYHPCSDCHDEDWETDPTPRTLTEDHEDLKLAHGADRIWCLNCHHTRDRDSLTDGRGATVATDEAHRMCATCHAQVHRDFLHGAHGKRVGGHSGTRVVQRCAVCHDPHAPAILPRKPMPPPARVHGSLLKEAGP